MKERSHDELQDEVKALRRLVLAMARQLDRLSDTNPGPMAVDLPRELWLGIFAGLALPQMIADAHDADTPTQVCQSAVMFGETLLNQLIAYRWTDDADIG